MGWLTLLTQIATWVTILLVLFTLLEMRNQRKAAQKPDLLISESSIYVHTSNFPDSSRSGSPIPRAWSRSKELKASMDYPNPLGVSIITLYNVGFGVAKNITLTWTSDYDKTIQQLKDYFYRNSIPIIIQVNNDGVTVIEEEPPKSEVGFVIGSYSASHDFLMPVSITSEGLVTDVPNIFVELVSLYFYSLQHHFKQKLLSKREIPDLEIDKPTLELELHYDDMENYHYSRKLDVTFAEYISIEQVGEDIFGKVTFGGRFVSKSKK